MTKEELKQKAKDFIDRINKESDGMWLNNYYLSDLLVMFATEATKELQEEYNELKGKLVLSDMVLTDKTKRIKELEDKLMDKVCLESLDIVSGKIKQLEKENAELKDVIENDVDKKIYVQLAKKAELADVQKGQLTKAKELLVKWVELFKPKGGNIPPTPIQVGTEQFLKEVEK